MNCPQNPKPQTSKTAILTLTITAILVLLYSAAPARATPITIEIQAIVDSVTDEGPGDGYLDGQVEVNDIITGTYTYESTTPDSNPSDKVGDYEHSSPPFGISLSVGGFDFRTDPCNVDFVVGVVNDYPSGDGYLVRSYNNLPLSNGTLVDHISWQLDDPTATALSSDVLPTMPPVLDDWQSIVGLRLDGERGGYIVRGHVTSAIPEPSAIVLLSLGGLFLRKRHNQL